MAEGEAKLKPLKAILEAIREQADCALRQLHDAEDQRSMRWKCKDCGYMKRFTRPVPQETADDCPKCKGRSFEIAP
jgi:Zn finger protein HypA/HybF involved in hydrogenase expression